MPQSLHCSSSVQPPSLQVGSFPGVRIVQEAWVQVAPQSVRVHFPVSLLQRCPRAGISSWAVNIPPQTEQWEPSVKPVAVQLAGTASSVTGVWSAFCVVCWVTNTSPQTEQWEPSVRPVAVQLAGTASSVAGVWSAFCVVCWATNTSPQTEQWDPSVNPVAVQVASTARSVTAL